jgi:hypothetical protein
MITHSVLVSFLTWLNLLSVKFSLQSSILEVPTIAQQLDSASVIEVTLNYIDLPRVVFIVGTTRFHIRIIQPSQPRYDPVSRARNDAFPAPTGFNGPTTNADNRSSISRCLASHFPMGVGRHKTKWEECPMPQTHKIRINEKNGGCEIVDERTNSRETHAKKQDFIEWHNKLRKTVTLEFETHPLAIEVPARGKSIHKIHENIEPAQYRYTPDCGLRKPVPSIIINPPGDDDGD